MTGPGQPKYDTVHFSTLCTCTSHSTCCTVYSHKVISFPSDLEWKIIYVGSASTEEYDQVLDSVLVGPIPMGSHKFVFQVCPSVCGCVCCVCVCVCVR